MLDLPPPTASGWYTGVGSAAGLKVRVEIQFKSTELMDVYVWSAMESVFGSRFIPDVCCSLKSKTDSSGELETGPELMDGLKGTVVTGITIVINKTELGTFEVPLGIGLKISRFVPHFTLKALLKPAEKATGAFVK